MLKFLIFIFNFIFVSNIFGQEEPKTTRSEFSSSPMTANFNLTYNSLANSNGQTLSGQGLELQFTYALKQRWGLGLGLRQMNLGSSGSASAVSFRVTFALTGSLLKEQKKLFYDKALILENDALETPCICLQVMGSQYYLNATNNTVPFTGYGLSLYYRYPTKRAASLIGGISYESVSNINTINAMALVAGIEFRI